MQELTVTEELLLVTQAKTVILAFEKIYDLYYPYIYRYCRNRLPNKEMTEDVVGTVFLKAVSAIQTFDVKRGIRFGSWLYRTAHNCIIDTLKKNRNSLYISVEDAEELPDLETSFNDPAERIEQRVQVFSVLSRLPERYQFILTLRFFEDFDIKRIAEIMGINDNQVSVLIYRSLNSFKKEFCKMYKTSDISNLENRYSK